MREKINKIKYTKETSSCFSREEFFLGFQGSIASATAFACFAQVKGDS